MSKRMMKLPIFSHSRLIKLTLSLSFPEWWKWRRSTSSSTTTSSVCEHSRRRVSLGVDLWSLVHGLWSLILARRIRWEWSDLWSLVWAGGSSLQLHCEFLTAISWKRPFYSNKEFSVALLGCKYENWDKFNVMSLWSSNINSSRRFSINIQTFNSRLFRVVSLAYKYGQSG